MKNFWKKLKKPFFCLAPMSDVTDIAFRFILAKYGKNRENKDKLFFGQNLFRRMVYAINC
jgi:tRNA-dihydrouridine synthase